MQNILSQIPGNKSAFHWDFNEINKPYYCPINNEDKTLQFESRFESGNLDLAIKVSENSYWLVLQNDSLTKGNTQCIRISVE